MSKKIILFLSQLLPTACEGSYECPDGSQVNGLQTNEAPVLYLLRTQADINEIICLVTPEAKASAWTRFCQTIAQAAPRVAVKEIAFVSGDSFTGQPLTEILSEVQAGDEIWLETTGGLRDSIMYLLLLSRTISYVGVKTIGAVYVNSQCKRVEDVSHLLSFFDLVGGMQDLANFGSVRTLRAYYGREPQDEKISRLLQTAENLFETIALCRSRQIDQHLEAFNQALIAAESCNDTLLQRLLPAFRDKFGKRMKIPSLIRWCVNSDMLQQALTIYTERIPAYIIKRNDLLRYNGSFSPPKNKDYQDEYTGILMQLYMLSRGGISPVRALRNYVRDYNNKQAILALAQSQGSPSRCIPQEIAVGVNNLALICRLAYTDNGFCPTWPENLPPDKVCLRQLQDAVNSNHGEKVFDLLFAIWDWNKFSDDLLYTVLEQAEPDWHTRTLKDLAKLLPSSQYQAVCGLEQLQTILRDYLYIKAVRNMTNHANDETTSGQKELMEYLRDYGYPPLEEVNRQNLTQTILAALEHFQSQPKGKKEKS